MGKETWTSEYFTPLEKLVAEYATNEMNTPEVFEELHQAQNELDMFRKAPEGNSSVYFIMERKS